MHNTFFFWLIITETDTIKSGDTVFQKNRIDSKAEINILTEPVPKQKRNCNNKD